MDIPTPAQMTAMADQWGAYVREQITHIQFVVDNFDPSTEAGQQLALDLFKKMTENVEMEIPSLATFSLFLIFTLAMNVPADDLKLPQ